MRKTITKILCLGVGLAMGLLLVAKVYFEQTYDGFFPNADRIYKVGESGILSGEYKEFMQTPGAVAPGIKEYTPQVEAATRYTYMLDKTTVMTDDGRKFDVKAICFADSCLFDVLPRPIIAGDYRQALAVKDHCMIPRSLAEKIGGNVIGMRLSVPDGGKNAFFLVGGVYEDFPLNSDVPQAIFVSLKTIGKYIYDGTENWVGDDRFSSYVRLAEGADTASTVKHLDKMIREHVDKQMLEGLDYKVRLKKLTDIHLMDESVKTQNWIMSLLAALLLLCASLNYLLMVFGDMVGRSKEMAVRKCYGTSAAKIIRMIFMESVAHLMLAFAVAALLLYAFRGEIETLLGATVTDLMTNSGVIWLFAAISLVILLITGVLPGVIYARIPVSSVFRSYNASRRLWKQALLAVELIATGFLFCLLITVGRQYNRMTNDNPGYATDNLLRANLLGIPYKERPKVIEELRKLSCVKDVTSAFQNLLEWVNGDNVWSEGMEDKLLNIADMYYCNNDFFGVLGIPVVQGTTFTERTDSASGQVMVDEVFVREMRKHFNWDENVVGRSFFISGHENNPYTICGVFRRIRIGNICNEDPRGIAIFYHPYVMDNLYIRLNATSPEAIAEVQSVISKTFPTRDITVYDFKTEFAGMYAGQRNFRDSVMIVGIFTVVISLIGLIGYTADEVSRRRKEIAIRKVNGTSVRDIIMLFIRDILILSVPSLVIGGACAEVLGRKWLTQFSEQVAPAPWLSLACIAGIIAVLIGIVVCNCYKVAMSNPVDYLKSE